MNWHVWNRKLFLATALTSMPAALTYGANLLDSLPVHDWAIDTLNLNIYHAMDSRLPSEIRAQGLKILEMACTQFLLPMRPFCLDEIHEAAIYLQNSNEPADVRARARKLNQTLKNLFPKGFRNGTNIASSD